jgi:1,4-alpha-glucan branching enzyme
MPKGFLNILLHAHLPYVRHPEHSHFFEENWLFEAITECYIPLLTMLDRLQADNICYRLTLSLSPTLISMLQDELLQSRYLTHLNKLIELSSKEIQRTQQQPEYRQLAEWYHQFFEQTLTSYTDRYQGNLLTAFKKHHIQGRVELITCAATHGFLPLLNVNDAAIRTQINVGVQTFTEVFGFTPTGFWLPECGYYPGLEHFLNEAGIRYFFADTHSITHASAPSKNSIYAPISCPNGVAVFARDPESSQQVWSAHEGYPGDFDYREYYSDIGFELESDYLAPYLLEDKTRINTGIKYHRITSKEGAKAIYCPATALAKAQLHAADFIAKKHVQSKHLNSLMPTPPMIVAPFDAELFGHWWFEGPYWLEHVLRLASATPELLSTQTGSDYLAYNFAINQATPSASTWGEDGYYSYWMNESNDWIYPYLHQASTQLEQFVQQLAGLTVSPLQERALNQALRSLLLAQSSDWPFIIKSGTTTDYATKRLTDHLARFNYLYDSVRKGKIDERYLTALEIMDNIFPHINFRDYQTSPNNHDNERSNASQ